MNHSELLKSMVSKFDSIMDRKLDIYVRQSIRLNSTVRVGMIILGVVGLSIFLLLYSLSSQVGHMQIGVQQMNAHFQVVEQNMHKVNEILKKIESRVAVMSAIEQDMQQAQKTTGSMSEGLGGIQQAMGEVSHRMDRLQQHMQTVNGQLANMQTAVGGVTTETYQMSRPMRKLP